MENIKKTAIIECPTNPQESFFHYSDSDIWREGFIAGAVSDAAKEYHQKGLYTKEDIKFYATRFAHQCRLNECATNNDTCNLFDKWFEGNTSENLLTEKRLDNYIKSISDGKPIYTEAEIIELLEAFKVTMEFAKKFGMPCDIMELFEENKKK